VHGKHASLLFDILTFTRYAARLTNHSPRTLSLEKLVVCCIPHPYSKDPEKLVMVIYLLDSCLEHKPRNCTDFFETTIVLRLAYCFILLIKPAKK